MRNRLLLTILMLWVWSVALFAGTTGKIAGQVTDSKTGEPLIGANVIVEGTLLGAAADLDGFFVILNVPPGEYNLRASIIGYSDVVIQGVRVNIDLTTNQSFTMAPTVLEAEDAIVVVADRPVVKRDISASTTNIEAAEIQALPVQSVTEVVGLQAGVQGLEIRGSNAREVAFQVDGITLRDERDNSAYTGVSLSAVQDIQVQTGGFNAEYGNVRSGVVKVITKEGSTQDYEGSITYQYSPPAAKHFGPSFNDPGSYWLRPFLDPAVAFTGTANGAWDENTQNQYPRFGGWNDVSQTLLGDGDPTNDLSPSAAQRLFMWEHRRETDITEADYNIDAGFGGPVPFVGKKLGNLRFFASVRSVKEMFMVPYSRDAYREDSYQLKLTSDITNSMKFSISGLFNNIESVSDNDVGQPGFFRSASSQETSLNRVGFIDSRIFYDSYWALTDVQRFNVSAKLTHTLSPNTYYEVQLEQTVSNYDTYPNRSRDNTPRFEVVPGYFVDEAPFGTDPRLVNGIDGMLMGVRANALDSSKIATTVFRGDITSQVNSTNLVKAGFELVYNNFDMRYGAVNIVLPTGRPWTRWERSPLRGAIYVQDKLEYKGFIANIGLRGEFIDPGGDWYAVDPYNQAFYSTDYDPTAPDTFARASVDRQFVLSPRLGVSHPITEFSKLYFNYGHFHQMPISDRLYGERRVTLDQLSVIGDPNLPLEKTVAYELGYEHSLFEQYLIRIAGYYKDITNQADLTTYNSTNGKVRYSKATSNSYADIRGAEFTVQKRMGRWFGAFANFTYQAETSGEFGLGQFFEDFVAQQDYEARTPPNQNRPVAQPYARVNMDFRTPINFGPNWLDRHFFGNWRASLLGVWQSGAHFTWTEAAPVLGLSNNVQWTDYYNIDLRFSRVFDLPGIDLTFFADISNLFNFKIWRYQDGFVDGEDYSAYMRSLRLPKEITDEFGYVPANGYGDDRPGTYRPNGVAFDPLEENPGNDPEIERRNQERIDNRAYIDNPNLTYLQFLNPRDIFFGLRVSFKL